MARLHLSQAERELCFVPPHEQLLRAKERRARMSGVVLVQPKLAAPVECVADIHEQPKPISLDEFINEIQSRETDGFKPISTGPEGHTLAKRLMRLCEEKHGLERGDIAGNRRSKNYVTARHEFIQILVRLSDWSLPIIGRFIKRDHTTVLHAVQKHSSDPQHAAAYEERRERARASVGRRLKDRANYIPKGPRWTPQKDSAVINMLASGMSHRQIAENITGKHSIHSVHGRVKRLRDRGQL